MPDLKFTNTQTVTFKKGRISASDIRKAFDLPENAKVVFQVPGGGDWSNTEIEIDCLEVEWKETS